MDEIVKEVEIALRDGLIEELISTTETGVNIITRLTSLVTKQEESIMAWEIVASQLKNAVLEAAEQRDRARDLAVRLEQECHSCSDTVHHGNEEQYDKD
jgi:uncharacterized protein with PIN domain